MQVITEHPAHQVLEAKIVQCPGILLIMSALGIAQAIENLLVYRGTGSAPPGLMDGFINVGAKRGV